MEEQGLAVVKESFFVKITTTLKRFFFKGKLKKMIKNEEILNNATIKIDFISQDVDFIQEEILNARKAFRKYVINHNKDISEEILNYVIDKIKENENKIRRIIEINKDTILYEDIVSIIEKEKINIAEFKLRDKNNGCYQVPIGVIGIVCRNTKDAISNMIKSISTRNSIIILHENYNKYSTESLIFLILQECFKNFYIDENIVQIFEKEEIDSSKLDRIVENDGSLNEEKNSNIMYIYQEDDYFESDVMNEVEKVKSLENYKEYEVKIIKGEFGNIINYINKNKPFAVCMYTKNSQKAYKFINWINSNNVFINTGFNMCKSISNKDKYFKYKYVLHEGVF